MQLMNEDAASAKGSDGFEPPKYLVSLIAAVNDGAKAAQGGALFFALVGVYLVATAFSASDEDLLRGRTVTISQIGANLPVSFTFAIAPFVFVFLHIYTLARYDMLAANVRQFLRELQQTVPLKADRERCRQLLANVEFIQILVAPRGSRQSSLIWRWLVWVVVAIFPVFALLLVQINALRYQSQLITWLQRLGLLFDLYALVWFFRRNPLDGTVRQRESSLAEARGWAKLLWLPAIVMGLNLVYLNVVPATADVGLVRSGGRPEATWEYLTRLFCQPLDAVLCPSLKWGCRYLRADHRTLVDHVWNDKAMADLRRDNADQAKLSAIEGLVLRDRSLRFAALDESSLFAADLIGADLRRASLVYARLPGAKLSEAQLQSADLSGAGLQGANLNRAELQATDLRGVQLQSADLHGARLQGADLEGADLTVADLLCAYLRFARLQGANLKGAALPGANLTAAQLQGADLSGAELWVADLSETDLRGADLSQTFLQGADLSKTQLQGANLNGAQLWRANFATETDLGLSDLRKANFTTQLTDNEIKDLRAALDAVREAGSKKATQKRLDGLPAAVQSVVQPRFRASPEERVLVSNSKDPVFALIPVEWLTESPERPYSSRLADLLAGKLASGNPIIASKIAARTFDEIRHSGTPWPYTDVACRLLAEAAAEKVELEEQSMDELSGALRDQKIECEFAKPAAPN